MYSNNNEKSSKRIQEYVYSDILQNWIWKIIKLHYIWLIYSK